MISISVQKKRRVRRGIIGFLVLAALAAVWDRLPVTRSLEQLSLDYRYKHWNRSSKASPQVVYVDIDEQSLKSMAGSYGRWPWPRHVYKELLEFFSIGEPAGVYFDLLFTEAQFGAKDDAILAEASSGSGKMIVSHAMNLLLESRDGRDGATPLPSEFCTRFPLNVNGSEIKDASYFDYALPNEELFSKVKNIHAVNFEKDSDGIFRHIHLLFHYGTCWIPSLALKAALSLMPEATLEIQGNSLFIRSKAGSKEVPLSEDGTTSIHYYDIDKGAERIGIDAVLASAAELQRGSVSDPSQLKVNPLEFKDKIIIVGGSAAGLEDLKATPITQSYPGAMLNTTMVSNILQGDFLREPSFAANFAWACIAILICYAAALFAPNIALKLVVPAILILANSLVALWKFKTGGLHLDMVRPAILPLFAVLDSFAYLSFTEGAEIRRLRSTLMKFVSPAVAEALIRSGTNPSAEVGRLEELSVLFSDIRGFTTLSENYKPDFLVEWLNQYFARMTNVVFEKTGTLDKFIGDALMAFWGAPNPQKDHAALSISAALQMRSTLAELLKDWSKKYQGAIKIDIGIGINSGEVIVGNIGSDQRLEYTVIGDNVNLASRTEGLTKQYGVGILVTARTRELAGDQFLYRIVDCVQVKGKTKGVFLYEPLGERKLLSPETQRQLQSMGEAFEAAWRSYEKGDFQQAFEKFTNFAQAHEGDGPAQVYLERCQDLLQHPPKDWSGVYVAKSK